MGLGAGTFKPIISGTIARCTDESNSTLGFGIFYWSINLGAFLVPLLIVPVLRQTVGTSSVLLAAAIGTGVLLIPTIFIFREPPKPKEEGAGSEEKTSLIQTLANAFEIIYSPIILLSGWMGRSAAGKAVCGLLLAGTLGYGGWLFATPAGVTNVFAARGYEVGQGWLVVRGQPNLCSAKAFKLEVDAEGQTAVLSLFYPDKLDGIRTEVQAALAAVPFFGSISPETLTRYRDEAVRKTILDVDFGDTPEAGYAIRKGAGGRVTLALADVQTYRSQRAAVLAALRAEPALSALRPAEVDELVEKADKHPFLLLYVGLLLLADLPPPGRLVPQ